MKRTALLFALAALALAPAAASAQKVIVIDPGHGGEVADGGDPGGTGNGLKEKDVVLDVSLDLRDLLRADTADTAGGGNWKVYMTRNDDTFVGLSARASYANSKGADRFVSIHSNAFSDPSANGTETFAYAEGGQGAALRNLIQDEMLKAWGLTNRGNKTENFAVLRETAMPATLSEMAFITNAAEAKLLGSNAERMKMSIAHLKALQRHYDITPYVPGTAPAQAVATGLVTDAAGDPVAGAAILLDGAEAAATGDDGRFRLEADAGKHTLMATRGEESSDAVEVDLTSGAELEIDLVLQAGDVDGGDGGDGGDGDDGTPEPDGEEPAGEGDLVSSGGCSAGGAGAGPLGLALLALAFGLRRRRTGV